MGQSSTKPAVNIGYRAFRVLPFALTLGCIGLLTYCEICGEPFNVSHEDGLLEWSTVYFLIVCTIMALGALVVDRRKLTRPQQIFLVVLSILLLFAAGEELSWGQRLFDWHVPEALSKEAGGLIQAGHGDTAVHNLSFRSKYLRFSIGGVLFGVVLLTSMFLHGIWLPLALKRHNHRAEWVVKNIGVFVPPLDLGLLAFTAALLFHFLKPLSATEAREYKEFIIPVIFAFMLVHSYFQSNNQARIRASCALFMAVALWAIACAMIYI